MKSRNISIMISVIAKVNVIDANAIEIIYSRLIPSIIARVCFYGAHVPETTPICRNINFYWTPINETAHFSFKSELYLIL